MGAGEALRRVLGGLASGILMAGKSAPHFIAKIDYNMTVCHYIKIQYKKRIFECTVHIVYYIVLLTNQYTPV